MAGIPINEIIIVVAAFIAGIIDAIVGGGGLISIPALFTTYPNVHPATLLGTNKFNSICGTAVAAYKLSKRIKIAWLNLLPGLACAFLGSFIGAWLASISSPDFLRKLMPVILFLVLIYSIAKKDLGQQHQPPNNALREQIIFALIGFTIGIYDGYFGPGTGSFFIFLIVRLLSYDFLHAATAAKLLNFTTNLAALILFSYTGHIWWKIAICMAIANIFGSLLGTNLALNNGTKFIRIFFIAIVSLLICKTSYDAFF